MKNFLLLLIRVIKLKKSEETVTVFFKKGKKMNSKIADLYWKLYS